MKIKSLFHTYINVKFYIIMYFLKMIQEHVIEDAFIYNRKCIYKFDKLNIILKTKIINASH